MTNLYVRPEDEGAVGDGVTDDSAAFIAAIATGLNVELTNRATYLISFHLALSAGQRLSGNGAAILRAAQTITTTTTAITSGTTNSITVAAGTGANFKVGQQINVFSGTNYGTQNTIITSIVGDVITTMTAFVLSAGSPWSGTTTVALSFDLLATQNSCSVIDVVFNGNRANWSHYHWEITSEIRQMGAMVRVVDCYFHDLPGEGLVEDGTVPYGSSGNEYSNNVIVNTNGNGIHLSYSSGCRVTNNYISGCNLDAAMGHVGGCVTGSSNWENCVIASNYLANARCGVGQITSGGGRKVVISGNTFAGISLTANMIANGITTSCAVECLASSTAVNDITIIGNKFNQCNGVVMSCTFTANAAKTITAITQATQAVVTSTAHGLGVGAVEQFAGVVGMTQINALYGTILAVTTNTFTVDIDSTGFSAYVSGGTATGTYSRNYVVADNSFLSCVASQAGAVLAAQKISSFTISGNVIGQLGSDQVNFPISIAQSSDGCVTNNQLIYGSGGIQIINSSTNINVSGNECARGYNYGIFSGSGSSGILVANNLVENDSTANTSSYQGIALLAPTHCVGNMLNLVKGYAGIRINGAASCVVKDNVINAGTAKSLAIEAGSTLFTVSGNVMSKAMSYSATAGAGNFGTATVASGTTSIAVTHNVGYAPLVTDLSITPTLLGNSTKWWVSAISATTFTISVDVDPGAVTAVFGWKVNG